MANVCCTPYGSSDLEAAVKCLISWTSWRMVTFAFPQLSKSPHNPDARPNGPHKIKSCYMTRISRVTAASSAYRQRQRGQTEVRRTQLSLDRGLAREDQ